MRSRLRTILLISFVACHAIVLSAGPSLHGLLGFDHDQSGLSAADTSERGGGPRHALGGTSHDCAACHLLSLTSHNPDSVVGFTLLPSGRAPAASHVAPPPSKVPDESLSRGPPATSSTSHNV
ncbi:hypothetical protein [Paludisphaera soli]|uniref:hypothetical protein n=1 Tax=Paludisphaera soli TaxID=2712865 RepID=UPI0013EC61B4|nr:hypothetical protein [Paludisphaera soli]